MAVVVGDEDDEVVDDGGAGVAATVAVVEAVLVAAAAAFTSSELELPTAIKTRRVKTTAKLTQTSRANINGKYINIVVDESKFCIRLIGLVLFPAV